MATAELYLVPMPVSANGEHLPPSDAPHIRPAVWDAALKALLLGTDAPLHFDGRFPDAQLQHTAEGVDVNDIAELVGAAVGHYHDLSVNVGDEREVSVGSWSFYYRYLDAYMSYVVAHYALSRTTAAGKSPWRLDIQDGAATHSFQVTAVARVTIPRA